MIFAVLANSTLSGEPELISLGPFGGDVRCLSSHPAAPERVFLGTADGQLFLSQDGGNSWEKLDPGLNRRELVIDSLVFHPDNPNVLYAGGWELKSDRGELFLTRDGGRSWNKVDLGRYQSSIRAVALSSANPDHIAVGITEGVVVSCDGGKTWDRISRGYRSLYNVHSLAFHPSDEDFLFAGTWRLGWMTPDLGNSWERIQKGIYWDSHLFSIQINPENPEIVFAGACSGIYRSLNGGDQWTRLKSGLPSEAKRTRTLRLDPSDAKTVYAGTTAGLYRSVNNGSHWTRLLADVVVNSILVDPRDSRTITLGTDDAGVLKSTDYGESFVPVNSGFTHRQVGVVAVPDDSPEVIYASVALDRHFGGFFLSRDRGRTWMVYNSGLGTAAANINAILPSNFSKTVFLGTNQGLFRGVPEKEEWSLIEGTSGVVVGDLDVDPERRLLYAACSDGLRRLDIAEGKLAKYEIVPENPQITSVLVDNVHKLAFAGTRQGVYVSGDGGVSWKIRSKGLEGSAVNTLEKSESTLLCGTESGLFFSEDHGESWKRGAGVFPVSVVSIKVNPFSPDYVVAANMLSGHFLSSADGGQSWQVTELGPSLSRVSSFAFTSAGDLLAGTFTEGVFQIVQRSGGHRLAAVGKSRD